MAKTPTAAARRVLADLEARRASHQRVLAGVEALRQRHAFAASQGDEAAVSALEKAAADERCATEAIRNLNLAIAEARSRVSSAAAHDNAAAEREREREAAALVDEFLKVDFEVVAAARALRVLLDQRQELVGEIIEAGAAPNIAANAAIAGTALGEGLATEFAEHMRDWINNAASGTLERMVDIDHTALGRKPPARVLKGIEKVLAREAEIGPTGWAHSSRG
jgi:hypothetical protein